jgi:hypothetical protein
MKPLLIDSEITFDFDFLNFREQRMRMMGKEGKAEKIPDSVEREEK